MRNVKNVDLKSIFDRYTSGFRTFVQLTEPIQLQ